jgi:transposase-like protein
MRRHRRHRTAFKRQVVEADHAGASLYGLARTHDVCRNLIRVRLETYEAGAFNEEVDAANMLHAYEARIAALERLVGKPAREIEFRKGAANSRRSPRSGPTSAITGPVVAPSREDAS